MVRLLLLIIAFCFATDALAADCGQFKVVKGKVTFKKKSKKKFKKARINKKVCQGDLVKTGKNSRAKIIMADQNEINISPSTELLIEVYQKNKKAVLNVLNGKVRSNVKKKYQDNNRSHYRVKTKSAVAGVRGTEFMASYNANTNQSRVVTFEGEVMVGKIGPGGNISGKVSVKPGQYTSNKPGQDPHPAKEVPPAELAQMDRETNVSDSAGAEKGPASTPDSGGDDSGDDSSNDDGSSAGADDGAGKEEPAAGEEGAGDDRGKSDSRGENGKGDGQANNDGEGNNGRSPKADRQPASNDDGGGDGGGPNAPGPDGPGGVAGDGPDGDGGGDLFGDGGDKPEPGADPYAGPNDDSAGGGDPYGDGGSRDPASIDFKDGGGGDNPPPPEGDVMAYLPPPDLDNAPDIGGDIFEPPPIIDPSQLLPPPPPGTDCLTCNDAVINQKVKVIIVPVLPGAGG